MRAGLLDPTDAPSSDGVMSEAASQAIDAWLERELQRPDPSEEACRRHYAAHAARYRSGESLCAGQGCPHARRLGQSFVVDGSRA